MRLVRLASVAVLVLVLVAPAASARGGPISTSPSQAPAPCVDLFDDVVCGQAFFDEISWLVDQGIAEGYNDGTFRPASSITRQAMAAFLYRLEGSPPGPFPDPGFPDVATTHPFHTEIAWMAQAGISEGFADGTFRPRVSVPRQAMAAFLYRLEGSPPGPFPDPGFPDVATTHPFHTEIAWMAQAGITIPSAAGTPAVAEPFEPAKDVLRRTTAAYLYRLALYREVDVESADRCEFLADAECLLPFPSDHFTVADDAVDRPVGHSDTGLRLNLDPASMLRTNLGIPVDPTQFNMNDGFSPGQMIVTLVPGIDLAQTDAPRISDISRALEQDAPIVIIDAANGTRVPLMAELDANASTEADRALIIRPTVNYLEGHRYIVAMRNLKDASGTTIEPGMVFQNYRDDITAGVPVVEDRRPAMEAIFATLESAGVARDDLYLAWDFTVASERNLSERILHMRDEAFAALGSAAPGFTASSVEHPAGDPNIATRVRGTFEVPRYLQGTGATGSYMNYGFDGLPEPNGMQTANFDCIVPHAATAEDPAGISLFGHGLLGTASGVTGFAEVSQAHNTVFCGTDWIGMATEDVPTAAAVLVDLSKFPTIPDRAQQGFLNFLFLGRLLEHGDGFASDPAFQDGGESVLDDSGLVYVGGSQGGIMGGALTAVAQDWTRSVLAVPGMNYSTLLRRSSNWPTFEAIMRTSYSDELDQTIAVGLIQLLWDRGESNGYAHHMTTDTYANTPVHEVLLFEAFGDHQVANLATETMARTVDGVRLREPALGTGRSPLDHQFWGIPVIDSYPYFGSTMLVWDWGTPAPPLTNTPPTEGDDPHGNVGDDDEAIAQGMLTEFLAHGGLWGDACLGLPCTSPP